MFKFQKGCIYVMKHLQLWKYLTHRIEASNNHAPPVTAVHKLQHAPPDLFICNTNLHIFFSRAYITFNRVSSA